VGLPAAGKTTIPDMYAEAGITEEPRAIILHSLSRCILSGARSVCGMLGNQRTYNNGVK